MSADPRLIVALDVATRAEAEEIVDRLGGAVTTYKVGLQLLAGEGMALAPRSRPLASASFSTGSCTTSAPRSRRRPPP